MNNHLTWTTQRAFPKVMNLLESNEHKSCKNPFHFHDPQLHHGQLQGCDTGQVNLVPA